MTRILPLVLIGLTLPVVSHAGAPELSWGSAHASFQALGLARPGDLSNVRKLPFTPAVGPTVTLPPNAFDPFLLPACAIVDVRTIRALALHEALRALEPCARALSTRYGVPVSVREGFIPPPNPQSSVAVGIEIAIEGPLPVGNAAILDLGYGLRRRGNSLLGHPAKLKTPVL